LGFAAEIADLLRVTLLSRLTEQTGTLRILVRIVSMNHRLSSVGRFLVHLLLAGVCCNLQLVGALAQEKAELTINRKWALSGAVNPVKVFVNDQFLGDLSNGKQETFTFTPSKYGKNKLTAIFMLPFGVEGQRSAAQLFDLQSSGAVDATFFLVGTLVAAPTLKVNSVTPTNPTPHTTLKVAIKDGQESGEIRLLGAVDIATLLRDQKPGIFYDTLGETDSDVDTNLFLLQVLEHTYSTWPAAGADPGFLRTWIALTRVNLTRLKKDAEVDRRDQDIINLYGDAIAVLGEYEHFLTNLGIINVIPVSGDSLSGIMARSATIASGVGYTAVLLATAVLAPPLVYPVAAGAGVVAGAGSALYESAARGKPLDDEKKRAIAEMITAANNHYTNALAGAQVVARKKQTSLGWSEVPLFDMDLRGDTVSVLKNRPHDPFVLLQAAAKTSQDVQTSKQALQLADVCVHAARRVPKGEVFNPYRAGFLWQAAELQLRACSLTFQSAGHAIPVQGSQTAVRLFDAADSFGGRRAFSDAERMDHILGLMYSADYDRAKRLLDSTESLQGTPTHAYNYACCLSRLGDARGSLKMLELAFKNGEAKDEWVTNGDPDLDAVRKELPTEFGELVKTKWTWRLHWNRVTGDTVELTNDSAFGLTNVALTTTVTANDKKYEEPFFAAYLGPGKSMQWKCSIPVRDDGAETKASLQCDQ
jgi:hypothetical protein